MKRAIFVLVALTVGCDPSAKAKDGVRGGEQLSRAYESCASSLDCADGLRCYEQVCRTAQTSVLGDYFWAAGERALASGAAAEAADALARAIGQYEAEELAVPAALSCAQGRALVSARRDAEKGELAARSLHRCLLGAPAGSPLQRRALRSLAELADVGLDPMLLAKGEEASRYLVKAPKKPPSDKVGIEVTSDSSTRSRSHDALLELLQSETAREALLPCWESNWESNQQKKLQVVVPIQNRFHQGVYEEDDRYIAAVEGASPPTSTPTGCVFQAVGALLDEFRSGSGRWDTNVTITMQ